MWYEQARYDNDYEIKAHCISVNFMTDQNMYNTTEILGDIPYIFTGPMNAASNGTGVIFFHSSLFKKIEHTDEMPVAVLALDVNNYAVMYDCKYDEGTKKRHDYLWIVSRFKTYGGETKAFVDDLLDKTPFLDKSRLLWQDLSPKSCNR
ncbi:bilin-binding protein-like [Aricia agestis]|uniref:bilin-binding protein-like n=1 Tax=Aricia agestis TaxID=91739 RepID=UPI001C202652|nr:bilin-binding protein-like [Aricia agestis]